VVVDATAAGRVAGELIAEAAAAGEVVADAAAGEVVADAAAGGVVAKARARWGGEVEAEEYGERSGEEREEGMTKHTLEVGWWGAGGPREEKAWRGGGWPGKTRWRKPVPAGGWGKPPVSRMVTPATMSRRRSLVAEEG